MSTSEAVAEAEEAIDTTDGTAEAAAQEATAQQPARPDLRVVPDEPDLDAVDEEPEPEAPWQYRLGTAIAGLHDQIPVWWSARPASWTERVDYSLRGDWTTSRPESGVKRQFHLIGTVVGIVVDAAVVTPLRWATTKPSLLGLLITAWFLLGHLAN